MRAFPGVRQAGVQETANASKWHRPLVCGFPSATRRTQKDQSSPARLMRSDRFWTQPGQAFCRPELTGRVRQPPIPALPWRGRDGWPSSPGSAPLGGHRQGLRYCSGNPPTPRAVARSAPAGRPMVPRSDCPDGRGRHQMSRIHRFMTSGQLRAECN